MNHSDIRVRYTKMVIEQSFLDLLKGKPVGKITVTELCQRAQINRATFYKHYLDIPDLLEQMEEQLFEQIRSAFTPGTRSLEAFLTEILQHVHNDQARYVLLGSDHGDPNLMSKVFLLCYESAYPLVARIIQKITESERQMLYHYLSHGSAGVLIWWIKGGMQESSQDVAKFIMATCSTTIDAFLKRQ